MDAEPHWTDLYYVTSTPPCAEVTDLNCALTAATETVLRTWAANGVPGAVEELARRGFVMS